MSESDSAVATPPVEPSEPAAIVIKGARTHNLKNIDLSLPTGKLAIITGVSGSGKSSLAFDTIYAEGQRRYVESLSAYARQFLERMEKPDVDRIDGIAPAIAIRQKNTVRNPRSTVGTTTEIHDYMRLLFARVGRTYCRNCSREVIRETAEVVAKRLTELSPGTRLLIGFDVPVLEAVASVGEGGDLVDEVQEQPETAESTETDAGSKGSRGSSGSRGSRGSNGGEAVAAAIDALKRKGFGRLLVDDRAISFDEANAAALADRQVLQVVVDRIQISGTADELRQRLTDSIETAYLEGGGAAWAVEPGDPGAPSPESRAPRVHEFSERFECRPCGITYEDPQPRLFSFNNPFGACPVCHGFGNIIELDINLVVPDVTKSIQQGAIEPWSKPHYRAQLAELKKATRKRNVRIDVPWSELSDAEKRFVIDGSTDPDVGYSGIRGFFRWLERKKYKVHVRVFLSRLSDVPGLRRRAPAQGSARRQGGRPDDRSGVVADGETGRAVLRDPRTVGKRNRHRREGPQGNPAAVVVSEQCRARLSDARSPLVDTLRWRGAANQPGDVARLGAGRSALCA